MTRAKASLALVGVGLMGAAFVGPRAARGERPEPIVHDVPMENAGALSTFYAGLHQLASGVDRKVRVFHFGDSNVAADLWTGVARRSLQERYGNGGPGFVVPGFGSRTDPRLVLREAGWHERRKGFARDFGPADGLWGLAGVAEEGAGGAWIDAEMPSMPDGGAFEVRALGRPDGGVLEVRIDSDPPMTVSTAGAQGSLVLRRFALGPGKHRARLHVQSRHSVRLLGLVVEQAHAGVVYDVLGINGHRASAWLEWNEGLLQQELAHRSPDLVVLSYGGNEALDPSLGMETYERHLEKVVAKVKRLMPHASLLLVGPIPMCPARPRVVKVAAIQRRVALQAGAAYWDSSHLSGDHASLCTWQHREPPLIGPDGLHLSKAGYALVAHHFLQALGTGPGH